LRDFLAKNFAEQRDNALPLFMMARWGSLILFVYFCWPALAQALQPLTGQYIRIELPGAERTLSLAEVSVYSGEKNIAPQGKATEVSTFADADAGRAIDGNTAGDFFARSVTSTATQADPWWELDLGSEKLITGISIHNRTDCCKERINPARVLVLDRTKQVVWEGAIKTTDNQYKFDLSLSSEPQSKLSPNLLFNATFQQRTNNSTPDYWDLHHVAALTLRNLHDQYGIDEGAESPVRGTKVLKIINSEESFPYLNLMPRRFFSTLPDGEYTYSVYLKAERNGMEYKVTRAWGQGEPTLHKLTTRWERYSSTFGISNKNSDTLQPVMYFPTNGTYYITAPQLERGKNPTPFQPSPGDAVSDTSAPSIKLQVKSLLDSVRNMVPQGRQPLLSAAFEYDYYTVQPTALLTMTSQHDSKMTAVIQCAHDTNTSLSSSIQREVIIGPSSSIGIPIPITGIPVGDSICTVEAVGKTTREVTIAKFAKLPSNPIEVRVNNLRRSISVNKNPFYIIGIGVGNWKIPPDWYFRDIADHGINTVFYTRPPDVRGEYDVRDVEAFLAAAARHSLKAIIGIPLAGAKVGNWRTRLAGFLKLIAGVKDNPTIIGWYPVDEPAANTWQDNELIEIYNTIKKADPYRLVFINWAYDGVPPSVGQEPRGTLSSTDIYSIDYYPFAGQRHNMEGFTNTTVRALSTAHIQKKASHSWIQIYGGMDAWREPTGDELNYMVYLSFIYGGSISYWDTKSNSSSTWQRISTINQELRTLADILFLQPEEREILSPTVSGNFIYNLWNKDKRIYLIVIHGGNDREEFSFSSKSLKGNWQSSAWSLFEERNVPLQDGAIRETLGPFERRVYVLSGN
jgi:hypothetical protein